MTSILTAEGHLLPAVVITPRGFAPRTPRHASAFARSATARPRRSLGVGGLSRAASSARSVRVGSLARSFAGRRLSHPRKLPAGLAVKPPAGGLVPREEIDLRKQCDERFGQAVDRGDEKR